MLISVDEESADTVKAQLSAKTEDGKPDYLRIDPATGS